MRDTDNISQYRSRLDQTLSSPDLVNDDMLKELVKNQILRSSSECSGLQECSSDSLVDRRTKEVASFLSMLRSASVDKSESDEASHGGWKVKQDTEEIRVMYREGPEGTPYHTILLEGYIDGPIDVCLCISWEVQLYNKWWPQTTIPTFKIACCQCLQKIRTDEQICLVRMKLSRPLTAREAVVHLFAFEYFQDGLIVVIANSISDLDSVERSSHDFIPRVQDVIRVDLVGGFALQKVNNNRSYFRTIGNLDIKLAFVPPALINFIARTLIGSGFKLFKKEVAAVAKGDEDYTKALKDNPLYTRTREALYSDKISNDVLLDKATNDENCLEPKVHRDTYVTNLPEQEKVYSEARDKNIRGEIEEIEDETCKKAEIHDSPVNQIVQKPIKYKNVGISTEVKQALGTLEKAISIIRDSKSSEATNDSRNVQEFTEATSYKHRNSSSSHSSRVRSASLCTTEANHNEIAPASSDVYAEIPDKTCHTSLHSSAEEATTLQSVFEDDDVSVAHENGINEKEIRERKRKLPRYCCL